MTVDSDDFKGAKVTYIYRNSQGKHVNISTMHAVCLQININRN